MADPLEQAELEDLMHREVVLDTRGPLLYLGTLASVGDCFYTLRDADVHDMQSSGASKEIYIMETAKHGIRVNRANVFVRKAEIVSLSLLADVIRY